MPKIRTYKQAIENLDCLSHKTDMKVLSFMGEHGWTVAHDLLRSGRHFPRNHPALQIQDIKGRTVNDWVIERNRINSQIEQEGEGNLETFLPHD